MSYSIKVPLQKLSWCPGQITKSATGFLPQKANVCKSTWTVMTAYLDSTGSRSSKCMREWWLHLNHITVIYLWSENTSRFLLLFHGCVELIKTTVFETSELHCEMHQENSKISFYCKHRASAQRKEMDEWGPLSLCRCPLPADRAGKACTAASSSVMNRCFSHLLINTFNTSIFRRVHFSRNMVTAWMIHAERPVGSVLITTCICLSGRHFEKWRARWVP